MSFGLGSSPLARGPPAVCHRADRLAGLIPARAGTTHDLLKDPIRIWAHPRSRGDHPAQSRPSLVDEGSSPLARGPHDARDAAGPLRGLIPARAGTTQRCRRRRYGCGAHPRSRGDHSTNGQAIPGVEGSSPLARGPLAQEHQYFPGRGLIPARAGTTQGVGGVGLEMGGSSPLARGPHAPHARYGVVTGLIPARAGTTYKAGIRTTPKRAHPRSRGDHVMRIGIGWFLWGSSPLARGPLLLLVLCRK